MTNPEYLSRFSSAARWRLSYQEAEEAICDYEDLLDHREPEASFIERDLGSPVEAARLLTNRQAYASWLLVFSFLIFTLALPFYLVLSTSPLQSLLLWYPSDLSVTTIVTLFILALFTSLAWFHPKKCEHKKKLPVGLILTLAVLLLSAAFAAGFSVHFMHMLYSFGPNPVHARLLFNLLTGLAAICTLAAGDALIKSRTKDRRWQAVYLCGLTILVAATFFLHTLTSLNINPGDSSFDSVRTILNKELRIYALIGLAGAVGVGGSLC